MIIHRIFLCPRDVCLDCRIEGSKISQSNSPASCGFTLRVGLCPRISGTSTGRIILVPENEEKLKSNVIRLMCFNFFFLFFFFSGLDFFETSAKENINVSAVFDRLIDLICDKMAELVDVDPTMINDGAKSTRLSDKPNKAGCAC